MKGKSAKRIRAFHFQSIRSSGSSRISPSGRCLERRPALSRIVLSPTINSVHSIVCELRHPSRRVVGVQMGIFMNSNGAGSLACGVRS
jgi:hypothetical protein